MDKLIIKRHLFGQLAFGMAVLCLLLTMPLNASENDLPDIFSYRANDLKTLRVGFENPPREAGVWVYWFWFSNVVNREEITRELEEMAEAGVGGVELRSISMYGFEGKPGPWFDEAGWKKLGHKQLEYMSPEFVDVLEHTLSEAERLGLRFAINLGMGWPPGGRWMTDEHRSKYLFTDSKMIEGPKHFKKKIDVEKLYDVDIFAWQMADQKNIIPESWVDLTSRIDPSGNIEWNAPEGKWVIGTFKTMLGGLADKGEGPEVDPASRESMLFHLNELFGRMEPQLTRFFGTTLVDVATDSWEFHRAKSGLYWSPQLLKSAPEILGYNLESRLHALLGFGPNHEKVLDDLELLQEELVHKNYFGTIAEFMSERGLRHRPQVYGRGMERDFFTANAIADIPEIEEGVYTPSAIWTARLLGKPISSCESFTHLSIRHGNLHREGLRGAFSADTRNSEMWQTTPAMLRAFSNAHFARGINRIQVHSFSYSPPGIPEPGWRIYAEIHLNRNVRWWPEFKSYCTWISRNQTVLQAGFPIADALVYPVDPNPIDGPWNTRNDQPWSAANAVDAANASLLDRVVKNRDQLSKTIRNVVLCKDIATLEEAQNLMAFVQAGVPLWCSVTLPNEWQGLQNPENDPEIETLRQLFTEAVQKGLIHDARNRDWQTVLSDLQSVKWTPETDKLSFQHRRVSDADIYLVSTWEKPFEGVVTFPGDNSIPELWDADMGKSISIKDYVIEKGQIAVPLKLGKNESKIVVFPGNK